MSKYRIRVSRQAVSNLFKNSKPAVYRVSDGLPDDAVCVGGRYDETYDCFWFTFETPGSIEMEAAQEIAPIYTKVYAPDPDEADPT